MASEPITMLNEYSRLLKAGKGTVFDWAIDPEIGFFKSNGQYLVDFGIYDTLKGLNGGDDCSINYIHTFESFLGIIRFPDVAVLSIIGIIIGFLGLLKFGRYSAKLSFSFTFFMTMNISGFLFHCILPISSKFRIICALVDQGSTGISGMFLAMELYSLYTDRDLFSFDLKRYLLFVWSTMMFSNVTILGEFIYLIGCAAPFFVSFYILVNSNHQRKDRMITKMAQFCFGVVVVAGIYTVFTANVCQSTGSYVNLMSMAFGLSDVAFGSLLLYGLQYYQGPNRNENDQSKAKRKKRKKRE